MLLVAKLLLGINSTSQSRAPPQEEKEPTAEQLQAFRHLSGILCNAPYVDHAAWGPFGRIGFPQRAVRTFRGSWQGRRTSYTGSRLGQFSRRLLSCLGILLVESFGLYKKAIERFIRFRPSAGHSIVTTDDKCRAEHVERIRQGSKEQRLTSKEVPPSTANRSLGRRASGSRRRTRTAGTSRCHTRRRLGQRVPEGLHWRRT